MKKFFTVIFFLLFAMLFTLILLVGELKFYVLTPAFIKDPLRETKVYAKVVNNADALKSAFLEEQDPSLREGISEMPDSAQKLTQAMLKSVDEQWLEKEAEKAIDALYAYATTDRQDIKLDVDLKEFKIRFRKNLYAYMTEEFNKLPEVPLEEFDRQTAQNPGQFPVTRPAGFTLDQTLAKIGVNPVDEIMKRVPDTYDTGFTDKNKPDSMSGLAGFKQAQPLLRILNIVFWLLLAIMLVLLLLFAKLTSKTWKEFLMRLGIFLSAAFVPFVLFALTWYIAANILLVEGLASLNLPSLAVRQIIEPLAVYAVGKVFIHLLSWSGLIGFIGLAAAIPTGILLRRRMADTL